MILFAQLRLKVLVSSVGTGGLYSISGFEVTGNLAQTNGKITIECHPYSAFVLPHLPQPPPVAYLTVNLLHGAYHDICQSISRCYNVQHWNMFCCSTCTVHRGLPGIVGVCGITLDSCLMGMPR